MPLAESPCAWLRCPNRDPKKNDYRRQKFTDKASVGIVPPKNELKRTEVLPDKKQLLWEGDWCLHRVEAGGELGWKCLAIKELWEKRSVNKGEDVLRLTREEQQQEAFRRPSSTAGLESSCDTNDQFYEIKVINLQQRSSLQMIQT